MRRFFFILVLVYPWTVQAADSSSPGVGGSKSVAELTPEIQNAINANSAAFRKFLTSGQTADLTGVSDAVKKEAEEKKLEVVAQVNGNDFVNKYFAVGLYANFDVGAQRRVQNARVVNGLVRIEESNNAQIGFALQAHRLFPTRSGKSAWGPFVAIISNSDGAIASGAIGVVYALAPKSGFVADQTSINFGLGISVSPGSQVLGDGITEDQPLPAGESEVRYKKVTLYGALITVSFGF